MVWKNQMLLAGGIPQDYESLWTMDNISGSTLFDETGNNDGTLGPGASVVSGYIGDALDFSSNPNGTSTASAYARFGDIPLTGDFCISSWWNIDTTIKDRGIFFGYYNSTSDQLAVGYYDDLSYIRVFKDSLNYNSSTVSIDDGWRHIVIQRNGSNLEIYVDKVLLDSWSFTSDIVYLDVLGTYIIGLNSSVHSRWEVDETYLYLRTLSQHEIDSLYNQ